jgi:single-stranded-DNA-specific exonuclease
MSLSRNRWLFPDPIPEAVKSELESFSRPFQAILYHRGCRTMDDALSILLPKDFAIPSTQNLRHLDLACDLINNAIKSDQIIAVYGDYDADGITSTALLTLALRDIGAQVIPYIPRRVIEGYGLNNKAIDHLFQQGARLLITVDNGIRSHVEVSHAKSLGMSLIITDHHQPPKQLPDADAVVNPKLEDDPYPFKNLAGVGVTYKLVSSLANNFSQLHPEEYLDLVAIGTIADIVPLVSENRFLAKQGLRLINRRSRQAIQSLIGVAGLSTREIVAEDISFQLAPRINSTGRLSNTHNHLAPLDLLLTSDPKTCGELAQIIDNHNIQRKSISRLMLERIESILTSQERLPSILFSISKENEPGVAGIVAGALTSKYYLPSIVGAIIGDQTIASCRSIPEFDIVSALSKNKDLFTQFGGHKLAAGFTIENNNLAELQERMLTLADSELSGLDLSPTLEIDSVVTISELDQDLYQELMKLEPTGEGNPAPLFAIRNVTANQERRVGSGNEHLKLIINDGSGSMPAIGFGFGEFLNNLPDNFTLAGYFSENEFRGTREFQIRIADLAPAS